MLKRGVRHQLFLNAVGLLILIGFQNCAQEVSNRAAPTNSSSEELGSITPSVSLIFSDTLDGPERPTLLANQIVYGVARGFGAFNVYGCASRVTDGYCNLKSNWTLLPNPDWTYSLSDNTWRMQRSFSDIGAGSFVVYIEDRTTGQMVSKVVNLTL